MTMERKCKETAWGVYARQSLFLCCKAGLSDAPAEAVQHMGQQPVAFLCQGEFPLEQGPIVQEGALVHGVDVHQLGGGGGGGELPAIQPFLEKLGDPLKIKSLFVGERFLVLGNELGGVQIGQQMQIHAALDHEKQLVVQIE